MLFVGDTRELTMSQMQFISGARTQNPKIATVSLRKDDPRVALVTGITEGQTDLFLTDAKGNQEKYTVTVATSGQAAQMAMLQRMAEQRRLALEEMIRRTVPTANVDVLIFGYTVVLKGTVQRSEDVQIIMELARSVYPEFQVPGSQTAPGTQPPPPPPGGQALPQGQGQGPLIINNLRIGGVQQVMIEVVIARVSRSELRNMSFNFVFNDPTWYFASVLKTPQSLASLISPAQLGSAASAAVAGSNLPFGFVNNRNSFIAFLEALRTEGVAKFLGDPFVVTLSGRPAYIMSGGEVPVLTSSGTGAPSVSYKQFGTVVNFLPVVLGDGKIYMEVRPEVSARNAANDLFVAGVTPTVVPGFDNRSAQVTVTMEDGETLAIGGLIQHTVNGTTQKVPVLGDLPFLGAAFRSVTYQEAEEELLILVTPRLVHPMACCQLPKYLPAEETRSPDDFELFLEGILEAPRGPRTALCGISYIASHHNGPTAGAYPCADSGCRCGLFGKCQPGEKEMGRSSHRGGHCAHCNNGGNGGNGVPGYNGHYNGHNGHAGASPHGQTPGYGSQPMMPGAAGHSRPAPGAPGIPGANGGRELPFSPVPSQPGFQPGAGQGGQGSFGPGNGGQLPPIPRLPQGVSDTPPAPASLGPVIEE